MIARAAALSLLLAATVGGDELSGADKLRVLWSPQFAWTRDGLPLVTVRITEGRDEIVVAASGEGVRVLPDGEGGAELHGGTTWRVKLDGAGRPVKLRWHVVVARAAAARGETLQPAAQSWRDRGFSPRSFEVGSIFGVRGEVIDARERLLTVAPHDDEASARAEAKAIAERWRVPTSLHPEVVERSGGTLVARDERGTILRNDSVIWFEPDGGGLLAVEPTDRAALGSTAAGERRTYAGAVYVTVDSHGKLAAVNAVPEDRLLAGLLPAEIGAQAKPEALKAQAVAARNTLLARMGARHPTDPYRLCSTVHCQVYAGAGREEARATEAVDATRGELLVRDDGSLVDAVYSGSCGGHTEDNDRAWAVAPDGALRGRLDATDEPALAPFSTVKDAAAFLGPLPGHPWCEGVKGGSPFRWSARVEAATVEKWAGVGSLREVEVLERGVSGRVTRLRVTGARGTKEARGELEVRRALGMLKSALITFTVERDGAGAIAALAVRGGGHGHGIGLCQTGAMGMALAGKTYREILQHYYSGATVRKLY